MNRTELKELIFRNFGIKPDYPWEKYPDYEVFRHRENDKWFALIMTVPRNKIGLQGRENIEIVNFKCDTLMIGSLLKEKGIYPAYHMNKKYWVSAALDGSTCDDTVNMLLNMSYMLTDKQKWDR